MPPAFGAGPVFDGPAVLIAIVAQVLLVVVVAFLMGGLNPATLGARLLGKDRSGSGSGNPRATSAGRDVGVEWGIVVGVLDVAKGFVLTWLGLRVVGTMVAPVVGLAVVAGHMYSPFRRGKGGKGFATVLGAMLALSPWYALMAIVVFTGTILAFRITRVGSAITCAVLIVGGILGQAGVLGRTLADQHGRWVALVCALVLWRHRGNLMAWLRMARSR